MPAEPGPPEVPLTSADDIRRATVGPVIFRKAPMVLVAYDPGWSAMFEREASRIRAALDSLAMRVEHVGSTSVPGLAAKPIIDIVLPVPAPLTRLRTCRPSRSWLARQRRARAAS
jgi:GrpB-like predicted nucleotidyltransferase (UPF0157 family)